MTKNMFIMLYFLTQTTHIQRPEPALSQFFHGQKTLLPIYHFNWVSTKWSSIQLFIFHTCREEPCAIIAFSIILYQGCHCWEMRSNIISNKLLVNSTWYIFQFSFSLQILTAAKKFSSKMKIKPFFQIWFHPNGIFYFIKRIMISRLSLFCCTGNGRIGSYRFHCVYFKYVSIFAITDNTVQRAGWFKLWEFGHLNGVN